MISIPSTIVRGGTEFFSAGRLALSVCDSRSVYTMSEDDDGSDYIPGSGSKTDSEEDSNIGDEYSVV